MMFSSPSPSPTEDSGSSFGGVWPLPPACSELEQATASTAQVAIAKPIRMADSIFGDMRYSSIDRWWTALSGQANVTGVPWCRSGGSHVLAVKTVAVRVTPGLRASRRSGWSGRRR